MVNRRYFIQSVTSMKELFRLARVEKILDGHATLPVVPCFKPFQAKLFAFFEKLKLKKNKLKKSVQFNDTNQLSG